MSLFLSFFFCNYLFRRDPRKGIRPDPVLHLAPKLNNLGIGLAAAQVLEEELELAGALLALFLGRFAGGLADADGDRHGAVDDVGDALEVALVEAAGRHGRRAHAEASGDEGGAVAGNGVLVGGDADELQDALDAAAVDAVGLEVGKDEVVVGAAADNVVTETTLVLGLTEPLGERFGVGEDLRLVGMELGGLRLLQRHG